MRYFCSSFHFPPTCHCFWLVPYFPISERHKPSALLATCLCSGKLTLGRPDGLKKTSTVLRLDTGSKLTSGWCAMRVAYVSYLLVVAFSPRRLSLRFPPCRCGGARAGRLWALALMLVAGISICVLGWLVAESWYTSHLKVRITHIIKTTCMPC